MRTKFAAVLLFGVMPAKVRDYDNLLSILYDQCQGYMWESIPRGPGLTVFNAYTGQNEQKWLCWKRLTEDSKGLPKPSGCSTQPAYCGACPWCNIKGVRGWKTTYYPWALAWTHKNHPARARLREVFGVYPGAADGDDHALPLVVVPAPRTAAVAAPAKPTNPTKNKRANPNHTTNSKNKRAKPKQLDAEDLMSIGVRARDAPLLRKHFLDLLRFKPKLLTSEQALASGRRSELDPKTKAKEAFVKVSPYEHLMPGFPICDRLNNCTAHAFGNTVGLMAQIVTNKDTMIFTVARRLLERAAGRNFPNKFVFCLIFSTDIVL
jgi:hypothetical protein